MKMLRDTFRLLCLILVGVSGNAQSAPGTGATLLAVTGEVNLIQADAEHPIKDESQVVVWLTPQTPVKLVHAIASNPRYRLVQRNKRFEPGLLVIPVGSIVDFPNVDPWFHNVFSLYRGKRFDLGLYQAGAQRSVRFDRPGPSYLFCNIHPEMMGVVLAVDSNLFATTDLTGHYSIVNVPGGKYFLHVWYENAKQAALQALQRVVVIEGENRQVPVISIPVTKLLQTKHKNKYGQDYDPNSLKTDY